MTSFTKKRYDRKKLRNYYAKELLENKSFREHIHEGSTEKRQTQRELKDQAYEEDQD